MRNFENKLVRKSKQLSKLFEHLRKLRLRRSKLDEQYKKADQLAEDGDTVDYDLLVSLIPKKQFACAAEIHKQRSHPEENMYASFSELGTSYDSQIEAELGSQALPQHA